ncbi:hypothetical protein NM688_g4523 [Phlebia brevispora]|uniref:Uncharacterized protein n=1 Tax=Phlebia brevispora TaxID=194682 RepID=A0ACC1T2P2_9APHY|nr:hypothetical protein NM688_g4523 [Phlebia brevispora]
MCLGWRLKAALEWDAWGREVEWADSSVIPIGHPPLSLSMNYLRGAVNAISAPYQYYKDINPATLTGAIDVIVINRPKVNPADDANDEPKLSSDGDETELVCSPFHVRFGKWQVLRPADKKVNVYVNGTLIPFSMKIGDAGEAFFVFETDEEVPEEIVTSPILEATRPGEANPKVERTGRFGAKEDSKVSPSPSQEGFEASQEPDFLDLDATAKVEEALPATASPSPGSQPTAIPPNASHEEGEVPSLLQRTAELGKAALSVVHEAEKAGKDKLRDKSVKDALKEAQEEERNEVHDAVNAVKNPSVIHGQVSGADKGDEILPHAESSRAKTPEVTYGHDMVFDTEGYHSRSHEKERSDATVTNGESSGISQPSSAEATPGPSRPPSPGLSSVPFPRATSEPPPDVSDLQPSSSDTRFGAHVRASTRLGASNAHPSSLKLALPQTEEYSWEWGNFPQKTPVWTAFANSQEHGINRKGKRRMSPDELLRPSSDYWSHHADSENTTYGLGGRLTVDRRDPTRFRVFIEGRAAEFELSLVPNYNHLDKGKAKAHPGSLGGTDEVEDAFLFDSGKVDFTRFLQDESIISADNLVMRWASDT